MKIVIPIPEQNIDLIVDRSLEQLFINCQDCKDSEGRYLKYSDDEIIQKINQCLNKKPRVDL